MNPEPEVGQIWEQDGSLNPDSIYSIKLLKKFNSPDGIRFNVEIINSKAGGVNNPSLFSISREALLEPFRQWKFYNPAQETNIEYGVNCNKCKEFNPYAVKVKDFVCYSCKVKW